MVVKAAAEELNIPYSNVDLGFIEIDEKLSESVLEKFKAKLLKSGLEILDDKRSILIEKIKNVVIEMVHYADEFPKVNFSTYISEKLGYDYTYLSNLFTEVKGTTIQEFIILHKIEKAKELIMYNEMSIADIAYTLNYSSAAHFSTQFKKVTGLTPSFFKKLKKQRETDLEDL
ncbi:MAG: helix-turn-helix domain-containing protein [Chitinophagaceae bacterium]|jgi:YesN/AraC family two-component response regulator